MLTDVRFMSLQGPEDYHITVIVVLPKDLIRTIAIDHNFPSRPEGMRPTLDFHSRVTSVQKKDGAWDENWRHEWAIERKTVLLGAGAVKGEKEEE